MFFTKKAYTQINKSKIRKVYRERKKKKKKKNYRAYVYITTVILFFLLIYYIYNLFILSYKQRNNIIISLNLNIKLNIAHSLKHLHGKPHEINKNTQYKILHLILYQQEEAHNNRHNQVIEKAKDVADKFKVISDFLLYTLLILSWHKAMNLNHKNSNNDNQFDLTALKIKRETLENSLKSKGSPKKSSSSEHFDFLTPRQPTVADRKKNLCIIEESTIENIEETKSITSDSSNKRTRASKDETKYKEEKRRKTRSDKGSTRGPSKKTITKRKKKQTSNSTLAALQKKDFEYHAKLHCQAKSPNVLKSAQLSSINSKSHKKYDKEKEQLDLENAEINLNLVFDEDLAKSIDELSQATPVKSHFPSTPSRMGKNNDKTDPSSASSSNRKQQSTNTSRRTTTNPRSAQPSSIMFNNNSKANNSRQNNVFIPPLNTSNTKIQMPTKNITNLSENFIASTAISESKNLNAAPKANVSKYTNNNNKNESFASNYKQNNRTERNSSNENESSIDENDQSVSSSDSEKKERTQNSKKDELPLFSPRRAARKNHPMPNNLKPKSGPVVKVVFISEQYKSTINENDKNLIEYIRTNCDIEDFAVDKKGNLLLYTKSEGAADGIINNQNFFNSEQKINLGREKNPLLISNITLEAIDQSDSLRSTLNTLGIIGYDKVTRNQKDDSGLVKAYCETREKRLEILDRRYLSVRTNKWRFEMEFKPLLWTPDRCKFCHVLKRLHPNVTCNEENERCAKCAKGHKTAECTVHYSRYSCVNCDGSNNNRHSALDQRRCPQLKKWKKDATAKEMKRLREEVGKPPAAFYTDADSRSYSTVGGVKDDINDINKKLKNIEKSIKDTQSNNNDALLAQFKVMLDQNAINISKSIEKSSNQKLLDFRKLHNQEIDNKIKESEYRVTKNILSIIGQNDKLKLLEEPEKYDFESFFAQKYQDENENAMNFENSSIGNHSNGAL
jgi:hypothetical protein